MPQPSPSPLAVAPQLPGTIVADAETLLDFIGSRHIETGGTNANLPPSVLPELNQRLSHPIVLDLRRALLRDYPNIAGPYLLLRVMGLVEPQEKRLACDALQWALWRSLNPVEKYFALFEAWLLLADDKVLGQNPNYRYSDQFATVVQFLDWFLRKSWKRVMDGRGAYWLRRELAPWNAQLAFRFGLMEMRAVAPGAGSRFQPKGWQLGAARRTPWTDTVLEVLRRFASEQPQEEAPELGYFRPPEEASFGYLQPAFQPLFPEWKRPFAQPETAPRTGLHLFKVSLMSWVDGRVWRRMALQGTRSLEDLADAILDAFGFTDRAHAYVFSFRNRFGRSFDCYHADMDEGPYAFKFLLEDMQMPDGEIMKFLFDFGDRWRFNVLLEQIVPCGRDPSLQAGIIESHGTPPKQYGEAG